MLDNFAKPGAVLAVVSDSYDIYNATEKLWGDELRQQVIDSGATVVIRPDSGDPVEVNRRLIEILGSKFGYTVNAKGFKVLNNVRLIQGDGINELTVRSILGAFMAMGWSADNIAFGMGGALLQIVDRDTQKFAMKASSACINGVWRDVVKDPVTDAGKKSKAGRVTLWQSGREYFSSVEKPKTWTDYGVGDATEVLEEVFRDGKLVKEITFDEVRANARK
jgi:nicotinamide phosphoribosyltransferase